jgi:hypothetical protein
MGLLYHIVCTRKLKLSRHLPFDLQVSLSTSLATVALPVES